LKKCEWIFRPMKLHFLQLKQTFICVTYAQTKDSFSHIKVLVYSNYQ